MHRLRIGGDGETRYLYRAHVIKREVRDWDARGYGGNGWAGPKITWSIRRHGSGEPWDEGYRTRAAAAAAIDAKLDN